MNIPLIVLSAAVVMIGFERLRPGRTQPRAPGFHRRALVFNGVQAASVFLLGSRLDTWWADLAPWHVDLGTVPSAVVGYLVITFVYYWWHRARHEVGWLWRGLHQLHHSPARLEIITSFYKHPLEIGANAMLSSAILFGVVGLDPEPAAIAVLFTGLAELVYHWNIRTPRWLGWVFQRPEMHCVHHERDRHTSNFSDLPLWDILFGTFDNPPTFEGRCGFSDHREAEVGRMLGGHDVNDVLAPTPSPAAAAVLTLGLARMAADSLGLSTVAGIAAATAASPAPKVFTSFGDFEPFSTAITVRWTDIRGTQHALPLHPDGPRLEGAYNRRNAYGAVVVFLPEARHQAMLAPMFDAVSRAALCGDRPLFAELGVDPSTVAGDVELHYDTRPNTPRIDPQTISCTPENDHA